MAVLNNLSIVFYFGWSRLPAEVEFAKKALGIELQLTANGVKPIQQRPWPDYRIAPILGEVWMATYEGDGGPTLACDGLYITVGSELRASLAVDALAAILKWLDQNPDAKNLLGDLAVVGWGESYSDEEVTVAVHKVDRSIRETYSCRP